MNKKEIDGWEYWDKVLRTAGLEPTNITQPAEMIKSISAPKLGKSSGKLTLLVPDDIFNNKEDVREFNKGEYQMLIMFVKKVS